MAYHPHPYYCGGNPPPHLQPGAPGYNPTYIHPAAPPIHYAQVPQIGNPYHQAPPKASYPEAPPPNYYQHVADGYSAYYGDVNTAFEGSSSDHLSPHYGPSTSDIYANQGAETTRSNEEQQQPVHSRNKDCDYFNYMASRVPSPTKKSRRSRSSSVQEVRKETRIVPPPPFSVPSSTSTPRTDNSSLKRDVRPSPLVAVGKLKVKKSKRKRSRSQQHETSEHLHASIKLDNGDTGSQSDTSSYGINPFHAGSWEDSI